MLLQKRHELSYLLIVNTQFQKIASVEGNVSVKIYSAYILL